MQTRLEVAIAGEVLAEVKRQRYTYKEIQERSGVKSRAWGYYFREGDRSIPFPALAAVCEVLGVKPSELIARAEERVARDESAPAPMTSAETAEHALSQVSSEAQEAIRAFKRADAVGSEGADDGPGSLAN